MLNLKVKTIIMEVLYLIYMLGAVQDVSSLPIKFSPNHLALSFT